jgi:hypothetical protein
MLPELFDHFLAFIESQRLLGLEQAVRIAGHHPQPDTRTLEALDGYMLSKLSETDMALFYVIQYFTVRKLCSLHIVMKIAPMVMHSHLWVSEQAKLYLAMMIERNIPHHAFFMLREVFAAQFPILPKDMTDGILLP